VSVLVIGQSPQPSVVNWQQQLAQASSDSTRVRLCLRIAQYYHSKTEYDRLYPYVQQGLKLLTNSPSHAYASELYYLLSKYYRDKGQYRKGIPFGQQSVEHAFPNPNPRRIAQLQYNVAVLYLDAGDLSKAAEQIGANLRYLQHHEYGPMRAANYLLMIALFQELKNDTMADQYWQSYIALDKRSWPVQDKMVAYINAGEHLEEDGKLKEAESQYEKGLYYANLTPNPDPQVIYTLQALGINARKQKHYQRGIVLLQRAFARARSIKNISYMSSTKREMAEIFLVLHRPQDALREAQYALSLARQHKEPRGLLGSLNSLGAVLEAQGQYRQALQLYREEQQLKEQKFTEDNVQKIALMQAQFETETKENTIKLLEKNAQINRLNTLRQQEQLASANQTQAGASLLIILLLLVIGLTIYNLRKSRLSNALLTQQQVLIQQTASQLAESNNVKDKLFSLIAHDLRSPVASIKNSLCRFREPNQQPAQLATLTERLDKQVDNLLVLLTNLLDWSMIQLTGIQVSLTQVPLVEVVNNVLSQVNDQAGQKQLTIVNQVNPDHVALADPYQLEAVIRNLVSNAIKFTPTGGFIRLVTHRKADRVELQVRDSGLGMSAEQVATLFTRPDVRSGTHGEKGTGLGLRLCRDMLERQGGDLQIESREGQGTFVRIWLEATENIPLVPQLMSQNAS
jgi:signal transduction histidine kinase